ncbi:hypothetical protein RclHR1_26600004 [Rhizophagus clarus]|uniref:Uncharacterized protein n=1 Tax=Rhizophagus clarus TaxID=94130 RepID=A0A2Z6R0V3_9GLOM|nr:hypothetical protein RclHR1_26600004 [Rhizophagus clarus]
MHTPTIFDQTDRARTLARYDSAGPLASIPSRNEIVAEYDNGMTAILQQSLSSKQPIHFMPTEVSNDTKYINGVSTYILRVSGCLINGQKAVVNITAHQSLGLRLLALIHFKDTMQKRNHISV